MKALSTSNNSFEEAKARREARERAAVTASLKKLEDKERSTIPCPDCGRGTCWHGAKVTRSPDGKPERSVRPEAPKPMTPEEKEEWREHCRRWKEEPGYAEACIKRRKQRKSADAMYVLRSLASLGMMGR